MEVPTVTAAELRSKIDAGDTFVLVDALAPMVYAHSHLPGAINIPPSAVDPDTIGRRIPDRTTEVVIP
jgi:rhodanese-related sulfurtransferase